jgi:hypothetical protein
MAFFVFVCGGGGCCGLNSCFTVLWKLVSSLRAVCCNVAAVHTQKLVVAHQVREMDVHPRRQH